MVVLGGGVVLVLARPRDLAPASSARPSSAGGRRPDRSGPPRRGRRASARRATGGRARGRAPRRAWSSSSTTLWSGTSYSRSRLTERMPAAPGLGDGVGDVGGMVAPTEPLELAVVERLRPERQPRDAGADARPPASPRSSGPGFASSVTSASAARPNRRAHLRRRCRRPRPAASSDGRPAAEVQALERRRGPARTRHRAHRRAGRSRSRAVDEGADAAAGPRAAAPAYTTKSQYGQSETQNGMWTYSATGGPPPGVDGLSRSLVARLARPDDAPAIRRPAALVDLLDLAAARLRLARVPGAQEDREAGDRRGRGTPPRCRRSTPSASRRSGPCPSVMKNRYLSRPGAPSRVVSV